MSKQRSKADRQSLSSKVLLALTNDDDYSHLHPEAVIKQTGKMQHSLLYCKERCCDCTKNIALQSRIRSAARSLARGNYMYVDNFLKAHFDRKQA